jgi:hypothetical protein
MDEVGLQRLRRVAEEGVPPVAELWQIAGWCWETAESSGDARYCALARAFEGVASYREDNPFPVSVSQEIRRALWEKLQPLLDEQDPARGAQHARDLRQQLQRILGDA